MIRVIFALLQEGERHRKRERDEGREGAGVREEGREGRREGGREIGRVN